MGDALRALIDAVGLQVGAGAEVRSDDEAWTLDVEPTGTHAWVATRSRSVWVRRGDKIALVDAGTAALVEGHATITISSGPERSGPPRAAETYALPHEALFALTGVLVGAATLGPLADEVLALPAIATTGPPGAPSPDVGLALRHVGHLDGGRWHGAQQQALARLVVTTVLRDNPPPMLGDNGLARVLDRLFDPAGRPSVRELLVGIDVSARTLERRCVAATGCSPAQLGRWYRSLAVRSALSRGDRPSDVATRFGFSTTSSMRRALERVRPPANRR
ncbi:AraC family transcriptional regulator [Curtobacterium sp. ME12]|uniref:AraC family transcriptional regulator n=1 Tax=Curtobacterium sp. ME12 TaxID=2744253 RepID=UPI0015F73324|nr:helix-turn-helix domain-containing protein [Curtobacterium sp. ME12]